MAIYNYRPFELASSIKIFMTFYTYTMHKAAKRDLFVLFLLNLAKPITDAVMKQDSQCISTQQRRGQNEVEAKKVEKRTVLFVDDDKVILHSLVRGLLAEPYNILAANSCKEALEILQQKKSACNCNRYAHA